MSISIGYPCINTELPTSATTFRLRNFSEVRFLETVERNLDNLQGILEFNAANNFQFFRIASGVIPFASHSICTIDWATHFKDKLQSIGNFIKQNKIRISMHPDQFVLVNSPKEDVVEKSISELEYHCSFLDALGLDVTAKVQIHVGGVYGDKSAAIDRFIQRYRTLSDRVSQMLRLLSVVIAVKQVRKRLAIENDDRLFSLADCFSIHQETKIPIIFDSFHHECLNNNESLRAALLTAQQTWSPLIDGPPMIDYSSQDQSAGARKGKHTQAIKVELFERFLSELIGIDGEFAVMLEIKNKQKSATLALECLNQLQSGNKRKLPSGKGTKKKQRKK